MHFLGELGIDLKLLIAQIINFVVLLWLLKIFLYKPILKILEERVEKIKKIEKENENIERKREEVKKEEEEIIRKTKEKTKQILEKTKRISKEEKERILSQAGTEVRLILREAREKAEVEVKKIEEKEREKIIQKSEETIKEVLSNSFNKFLHRKYLREVLEDLEKLNFKKAKKEDTILVKATFAFPPNKEEEKEISDFFFSKLKNPVFEVHINPKLIAGVKISIGRNLFLIDGSLDGKLKKILYEK